MSTEYDINYDDQRFKDVESDKEVALSENEKLYSGMIENSDKYYQAQIDASKQWADKQSQLQQEKTDFAIDKIEQEKAQAKKDYTKEQSGAYVDWQKQSNQYGVNAEQIAAQGLQNSGYSESSQVSMYNTYQNRVVTARETFNKIVMNFNNSITEARLQNNSILAEIAYEAQQKQLELNLQGFQYKNQLLLEQAEKKLAIDSEYHKRYQEVLDQINKENALAEQIRQYNESMALEREQFEWQKAQAAASSYSSGGSSKKSSSSTKKSSGGSTINKSSSSSPSVDTKSVLALGYGPISGSTLASLESQGKVTSTVKNNKVTFSKTSTPSVTTNTSKYFSSTPTTKSSSSTKKLTAQQQKAYDLYISRR